MCFSSWACSRIVFILLRTKIGSLHKKQFLTCQMSKLKKISGKECVKILCNKFEFKVIRQKGSHIILNKDTPNGKIGTVVPNHQEIKIGTLKGILELAKIDEDEFSNYQ